MQLREYETVCIFKPYASPDIIEKLNQKLRPYVGEGGGELLRAQVWGRKRLAYMIGKERDGFYVCLHYVAPSSQVTEIEKIISYDENVLKYLTVKKADTVRDLAALKKGREPEIPHAFRPDLDRSERSAPEEVRSAPQEGARHE